MEQHTDVIITSTPREGNPVAANDKIISRSTGVAEEGSQIRKLNKNKVTTNHGQSSESHENQEVEKNQHQHQSVIKTTNRSELLTSRTMDEVNNDKTMKTSGSEVQSKEPSTKAMNSETIFIPSLGLKTVLEHQKQTNEPHPPSREPANQVSQEQTTLRHTKQPT